jgi:asparagine synthase (glutamine-hydrolysing)
LAFHGELYNTHALRKQLGTADDISLPELLMRAYERWSLDFVRQLDGLFALALHDGTGLHLYRDASGARNLYYSLEPAGQIAFATQLDTLLRLPGMTKRLARRSLHEYLRFLEIAAPNTLYEGVFALQAGHLLSWSGGECSLRSVAAGSGEMPAPSGFEEALDELQGLLHNSVESRLHGADKPAAFLSGGVDSSLICALAARIRPDLTAVTVGFDGHRYDETPVAQQVAGHLGVRHEVLRFRRQDHIRAFEAFAGGAEQPMGDPAAPSTLLAFEHCRERFDVNLDGSGADESMGMMPPRHVRIAVEHAARLPARLRRAIVSAMSHLPGLAGYTPIFDFEHPAELMMRWHGFARAEIESLCGEAVSFDQTLFFQTFARYPRHAHFERSSALLDALSSDRLHQTAALSGACIRYPYWNGAVDGYIRGLPVAYRYQPGEPKRLLRALLARHVPQALWNLPKHGFNFPLLEFLCAEDFQLVRRYLHRERWQQWQIMAPEQVAEVGRRFMAGDRRLVFRVWALMVLAAWLERHVD